MKTTLKTTAIALLAGAMLFLRLGAEPGTHSSHTRTVYHHTRSGRTYTRSPEVRRQFMREHPCPANGWTWGSCPGYVADHRIALCKGGPDSVDNLQWQTIAEGMAKDKWECK